MKVLCRDCGNKMRVPGSAHIECAWRRGHLKHVWFYEGFDPNYPTPVVECGGYQQAGFDVWTEEATNEANR